MKRREEERARKRREALAILGLKEDVSQKEIRKAYHRLALQHHPDKNVGNEEEAAEKFKSINEAYQFLNDNLADPKPNIKDNKYAYAWTKDAWTKDAWNKDAWNKFFRERKRERKREYNKSRGAYYKSKEDFMSHISKHAFSYEDEDIYLSHSIKSFISSMMTKLAAFKPDFSEDEKIKISAYIRAFIETKFNVYKQILQDPDIDKLKKLEIQEDIDYCQSFIKKDNHGYFPKDITIDNVTKFSLSEVGENDTFDSIHRLIHKKLHSRKLMAYRNDKFVDAYDRNDKFVDAYDRSIQTLINNTIMKIVSGYGSEVNDPNHFPSKERIKKIESEVSGFYRLFNREPLNPEMTRYGSENSTPKYYIDKDFSVRHACQKIFRKITLYNVLMSLNNVNEVHSLRHLYEHSSSLYSSIQRKTFYHTFPVHDDCNAFENFNAIKDEVFKTVMETVKPAIEKRVDLYKIILNSEDVTIYKINKILQDIEEIRREEIRKDVLKSKSMRSFLDIENIISLKKMCKERILQEDETIKRIQSTLTTFLLSSMKSGLNEVDFYKALNKALVNTKPLYKNEIMKHKKHFFNNVYEDCRECGISPYLRSGIHFVGEKVADFIDYIGRKIQERLLKNYSSRELRLKTESEKKLNSVFQDNVPKLLTDYLVASMKSRLNEEAFYSGLTMATHGIDPIDKGKIIENKQVLFGIYQTCREQGISPYLRSGIRFIGEKIADFIDSISRKIRERPGQGRGTREASVKNASMSIRQDLRHLR